MAAILDYIGLRGASKPDLHPEKKETVRPLPTNLYTSPELFELERRAIFSRQWLIVTHSSRIKNTGDFLRYHIAGFDIVLSRDRSGNVTAFHNVCRHRAYPVIEQDQGTAKIFSCRYHGWSYGLNGKLAKAPGYQDVVGFDKSQNGLLSIHARVDVNGFVWINLDAQMEPEISWERNITDIGQQERFKNIDFSNYDFDHVWKIDAGYNWKLAANNTTTHPDMSEMAGHEIDNVTPNNEQTNNEMQATKAYYWPYVSMTVSPHSFFVQKLLPTSATSTTIYYEIFRNRHSSKEEFQKTDEMFKRIMNENKAEKNSNTDIFAKGEVSDSDSGLLYFQKKCSEEVVNWYDREQTAKREIWPARQKLPTAEADADVDFCNNLSCSTSDEALTW